MSLPSMRRPTMCVFNFFLWTQNGGLDWILLSNAQITSTNNELAKVNIDLKFVQPTADVLEMFL